MFSVCSLLQINTPTVSACPPVHLCSSTHVQRVKTAHAANTYFPQANCACVYMWVCVCKFTLTQGPGTEARCNRLFQHLGWLACCSDLSAAGRPANTSLLTAALQLAVYYCRGPRALIAICQYCYWQFGSLCVCVCVKGAKVQSDTSHQPSLREVFD